MKKKDVLIILILLFISVVAWIASSLFHSFTKSTISETTKQDIAPIEPTFDTKTIDKLKKRQNINSSFELEDIIPTPTSVPSFPPEVISPQNASEEGQITP